MKAARENENFDSHTHRNFLGNSRTGSSYKAYPVKLGNTNAPLKTELGSFTQQQLIDNYVYAFFERIFKEDVRFRVIVILSRREGACLRELARNVGMSHKNLAKYLQALTEKGVIDSIPVGLRDKVYKLNSNYAFLRELSL